MSIKDKLNIPLIDIELSTELHLPVQKIKSLDTKSRYKRFRFFYNGLELNLDNITARVYAIKPDGKEIFNDLIKIDNNIVELEFTNQALINPGILQLELVLYEDDAELSSFLLEFEIIKSIRNSNSVESSNEFGSLQIALRDVEQLKNNFQNLYNEKEATLNKLKTDKESELNSLKVGKENELNKLKTDKERELTNTNDKWTQKFQERYDNLNSEFSEELEALETGKADNEHTHTKASITDFPSITSDINSSSETNIANSNAVKLVNDKVENLYGGNDKLQSKNFLKTYTGKYFGVAENEKDLNNIKYNIIAYTTSSDGLLNLPSGQNGGGGVIEVIQTYMGSGQNTGLQHTIQRFFNTTSGLSWFRTFNVDKNVWSAWDSVLFASTFDAYRDTMLQENSELLLSSVQKDIEIEKVNEKLNNLQSDVSDLILELASRRG